MDEIERFIKNSNINKWWSIFVGDIFGLNIIGNIIGLKYMCERHMWVEE